MAIFHAKLLARVKSYAYCFVPTPQHGIATIAGSEVVSGPYPALALSL
jgi:hypothetical protein